MRHVPLLALVVLTTASGCDQLGDPDSNGSSKPATEEGAPGRADESDKAAGPVFKTKSMGMERSEPLVEKDLGEMELEGMVITAPESAKIQKKSPRGHKLVAAGVNYSMTIQEQPYDAKQAKDIFKLLDEAGEVVDESDDHIIFKRASGSHLFQAEVTVDGKAYTCSTVATGMDFQRDQVDQMIESCRTLKKKG